MLAYFERHFDFERAILDFADAMFIANLSAMIDHHDWMNPAGRDFK